MKAIVAVKFDDGTEAPVPDMHTLVRYITAFFLQQRMRAVAADTTLDWPAHAKEVEQRKAHKFNVRATNRANASKPRKPITKAALSASLTRYEEKHKGEMHGWHAALCTEFKITSKTLSKKMRDYRIAIPHSL